MEVHWESCKEDHLHADHELRGPLRQAIGTTAAILRFYYS